MINWNKGSANYTNRKYSIEYILATYKPDLMTVHKLNLTSKDDLKLAQIQGYKLEKDKLMEKFGRNRVGVFVKETIKYQRLPEIEVEGEPVIWIKIKLPGNKNILHQSYYRQWRQVDINGNGIPGTETPAKQQERLAKVAEIWSQQLSKGETVSMSDTNINLSKKFNTPEELSTTNRKLIPLYRMLQNKIFNNGAVTIKTLPTKIYQLKENTFIDHCITNWPNKVLNHEVLKYGFSDHLSTKFTFTNRTIILKTQI